jgi:hypothetical protein
VRARARAYFPAIVITPTVLSGFACSFDPHTKLTASCCASSREGEKSPFRMYSESSRLRGVPVGDRQTRTREGGVSVSGERAGERGMARMGGKAMVWA